MIYQYKPSGRISFFRTLLSLLIIGIIFIPIVSYLYSWAIFNIPFVYVRFFISIIFGILIGGTCYFLISFGKIRSATITYFLSTIIVIYALLLHWSSWIAFLSEDLNINLPEIFNSNIPLNSYLNKFSAAAFPLELFKTISIVVNQGVWQIKSMLLNKELYWLIIILEAIIIIYFLHKILGNRYKKPFCEISNQWMDHKEYSNLELIKDPKNIVDFIQTGNIRLLTELKKGDSINHCKLILYVSDFNNYMKLINLYKNDKDDYKIDDFNEIVLIDNIKIEKEKVLILENYLNNNKSELIKTVESKEAISIENSILKKQITNVKFEHLSDTVKVEEKPLQSFNNKQDTNKEGSKAHRKKKIRNKFINYKSGALLLALFLMFFYVYKNVFDDEKSTKPAIQYEEKITNLLKAEDERNLNNILSFYGMNMKRYWDVQNPSIEDLKKRYEKSWKLLYESKNEVLNINKISSSTYELETNFKFIIAKNRKNKSIISKVIFKFDNDGKIIEVYGLDE